MVLPRRSTDITSPKHEAVTAAKENTESPRRLFLTPGNGCSFAEGVLANHHMNFTAEQMNEALEKAEKVLEESKMALLKGKGR